MRTGCVGQRRAAERVVVAGGGFAGATCARYLKKWAPALDVTRIETVAFCVACPMSNRMLAGGFGLRSLARTHEALASDYGVRLVRGTVARIDHDKRQVLLVGGGAVGYKRLVVASGIDFATQSSAGLAPALDSGRVLHAWRSGGLQITRMRDRLAEMRPGGTVVVHVPRAPFRCPPGP
ncbi:MAG: FAD-dependent oxidoreductase [Burkholderiales bacterium]|nr:FAD-dependent oxidoreductase [Burkholderiales bacterium]